MEFINENYIDYLLEDESLNDEYLQKQIIEKASKAQGLTLKESAVLLNINSPELLNELFATAKMVKEHIYGNRIVIFSPLYLSNKCVHNCFYCAFRKDNESLNVRTLSFDEIEREAAFLIRRGHKRVLLNCGEHSNKSNMEFIGEAVRRIYGVSVNGKKIKRINISTSPLSLDKFRKLQALNIGTYQCFQETYRYKTFETLYPDSTLKYYNWHLYNADRAFQAGQNDIGLGVLFGLTDYKFETLALLNHAFDLDAKYGIGPHSIVVPRIKHAKSLPAALQSPYAVDDISFKKLIAVIRLAIPYSEIVLSRREEKELRRELMEVGISQISAGSRTAQTSFKETQESLTRVQLEQIQLGDYRPLDDIVKDCTDLGYLPCFCTACFQGNHNSEYYLRLIRSSDISNICIPNALSTFKEYLNDFASIETKEKGNIFFEAEINNLDKKIRTKAESLISKLS